MDLKEDFATFSKLIEEQSAAIGGSMWAREKAREGLKTWNKMLGAQQEFLDYQRHDEKKAFISAFLPVTWGIFASTALSALTGVNGNAIFQEVYTQLQYEARRRHHREIFERYFQTFASGAKIINGLDILDEHVKSGRPDPARH